MDSPRADASWRPESSASLEPERHPPLKDHETKSQADGLHDPLTGLPNLSLFYDRLEQALMQAKRHGSRLAVMFIDLGKSNDAHGPAVGDHVLKLVAQRLKSGTRGEDTISHRRGDEFLFLMPEAKDPESVAILATKIIEVIGKVCRVDGLQLTVKPSLGFAIFPDDGNSPHELLEKAEAAMTGARTDDSGSMSWSQFDAS